MTRRSAAAAAAAVAVVATAVAGCGTQTPAEPVRAATDRVTVSVAEATAVQDVVTATDRLGLELLGLLPAEENLVTSPASAVLALGMLAEGATGQGVAELDDLLGAAGAPRSDALNALSAHLSALDGDPAAAAGEELPEQPLLHLAQQLVVDDGAQLRPAYLEALARSFGAGVQHTDLASDAGIEVLSDWAGWHTGGLVEESAIRPDPDLRLVIQDAVLLAARWDLPFSPEATWPEPFHRAGGEPVDVETMHQETELTYAEVQGWQAVRLAYRGAPLHADVLLPPPGTGAQTLDGELLASLLGTLEEAPARLVRLALPRADLSTVLRLEPLLARRAPSVVELGSLGGISEEELRVSQAVQQAVLTIDEEGTVAAALTELGAAGAAAPEPLPVVEMTVDRPYLVRIAQTDTGWPLFLARVADPRG